MVGYILSLGMNIVLPFCQPGKFGKGIGNLKGREMPLALSVSWHLIFCSKLKFNIFELRLDRVNRLEQKVKA